MATTVPRSIEVITRTLGFKPKDSPAPTITHRRWMSPVQVQRLRDLTSTKRYPSDARLVSLKGQVSPLEASESSNDELLDLIQRSSARV